MESSNAQVLSNFFNPTSFRHHKSRDCRKSLFISSYLLFLLLASFLLNSVVLFSYKKRKKNSINIQIIAIMVSNIFASTFCLPIIIYSNLTSCEYNNWQISHFLCTVSGGAMYFNGCMCIFTMTTISIDR